MLKQLFRFYCVPVLRWHLQQKLLEQDHAASFGSFLWLCYLPNSVVAKRKCYAVMLLGGNSTNIPQ